MTAEISVVIATTASARRSDSLAGAIDSVLQQSTGSAIPVVVVNGTQFDRELDDWLRSRSDIRYFYLETGSLPKAIEFGRAQVDTRYFGFLDDDDVYLPEAIAIRKKLIEADDGYDVAVTAGHRIYPDRREPFHVGAEECARNCLVALASHNWLASCGGTFRTDTVGLAYFSNLTKYAEWTDVAIRISLDLRITFSDEPTFLVRYTEQSLSQDVGFHYAPVELVRTYLERGLPPPARQVYQRKLAAELHKLSDLHRHRGELAEARRYHVESLLLPGGWQYLPYSRKLI